MSAAPPSAYETTRNPRLFSSSKAQDAIIFPHGNPPDGWLLHVAGPTEGGWRVNNVVP
jgi:hypothetical protein